MATFSKLLLSSSISGKRIPILQTGQFVTGVTGTILHTCSCPPTAFEEIYLYLSSTNPTGDAMVMLTYGGVSSGDLMFQPVPFQNGRVLALDGSLIQSGLSITAWSNLSGINCDGFCNRIT